LIAAMGPLPRTHGMLGAMLEQRTSYRTDDIHDDPRFRGWWPRQHPDMRSFLGVPITAPDGAVLGAFYLTEKENAEVFDAEDQALIELLAAHASIAITNARLYEQSLELHDVVSQKLFSVMLTAEAAATQMDRDLVAARAQLQRLRELAGEALEELRSLILGLRPPELERDGLADTLRQEVEMVARTHGTQIELSIDPGLPGDGDSGDPDHELAVLRIAHEALHNAVRHAHADHVTVRLAGEDGKLVLEVSDDGVGFDPLAPDVRSRHLGLTSMEERARESHGRLKIRSAPGQGTTVRAVLSRDGA
jgi:signal transduction histidine kinase